jgi:hypothetical protein
METSASNAEGLVRSLGGPFDRVCRERAVMSIERRRTTPLRV